MIRKHFIAAALAILFVFAGNAEAKKKVYKPGPMKGKITIGSGISFTYQSMTTEVDGNEGGTTSYTTFDLSPGIGYFINNNFELRGNFLINYQSFKMEELRRRVVLYLTLWI